MQHTAASIMQVLHVLGDGGTTDMARRVLDWHTSTGSTGHGVPGDRIGGIAEVATLIGRSRQVVCNWITRSQHNCPEPFVTVRATPLYDLDQWRVWAAGHPKLVRKVVENG